MAMLLAEMQTDIRHNVSDDAVRAGTLEYLNELSDDWVAFTVRSCGEMHKISRLGTDLIPEKVEFSVDFMQRIHKDQRYRGATWVLQWRRGNGFAAIMKDFEGDVQFEVDCTEPWERVGKSGLDQFMDDCVRAREQTQAITDMMQIKSDQKFAAALRSPGNNWVH